jgi:phage tail-like protein
MTRNEIEQLLPSVFQRTLRPGSPLTALLDVMEGLHAPVEDILAHIDAYFEPRRTPDYFVAYLAGWVDLDRFLIHAQENGVPTSSFSAGLGRLRELIAAAAMLSKWRGTARGLRMFLEIATGVEGFEVDELVPDDDGRPRPFHVRVQAPEAARRHQELILRIIAMEKPAYVTSEVAFGTESE